MEAKWNKGVHVVCNVKNNFMHVMGFSTKQVRMRDMLK